MTTPNTETEQAPTRSVGCEAVLLGGMAKPLPPEIMIHYFHGLSTPAHMSLSDKIYWEEDIPFEHGSDRLYKLSLQQVEALRDQCDRILEVAGKALPA